MLRLLQLVKSELGDRLSTLVELSKVQRRLTYEEIEPKVVPDTELLGVLRELDALEGEFSENKEQLTRLAGLLNNRLVEVFALVKRVSNMLGLEVDQSED